MIVLIILIILVLLFVEIPWCGVNSMRYRWIDYMCNVKTKVGHMVGLTKLDKEVCYENMRLIHDIFGRRGIQFYLTFGTALGLTRGGDLLDWDDDVDIGAPYSEHKKIQDAIPDLRAAGFRLAEVGRDNKFMCFLRKGEKIDLDITTPGCTSIRDECLIEDMVIDEMTTIDVRGLRYNIVTEKFLESYYGKDWRTPRQSKW